MSPLTRLLLGTAALVALYFAVPIDTGRSLAVRAVLSALCIVAATLLILREVQQLMRREGSPLWGLALAVVAAVLAFALADYLIAITAPGQFAGLHTRVDGLYFALTTLATVGYGDVHAQGQLARAVVSIQLVFNLVIVTTAASVLVAQLRRRAARSAGQ